LVVAEKLEFSGWTHLILISFEKTQGKFERIPIVVEALKSLEELSLNFCILYYAPP